MSIALSQVIRCLHEKRLSVTRLILPHQTLALVQDAQDVDGQHAVHPFLRVLTIQVLLR